MAEAGRQRDLDALTASDVRRIVHEELSSAIAEMFQHIAVGNAGGALFLKLLDISNHRKKSFGSILPDPDVDKRGKTVTTYSGGGRPAAGGVNHIGQQKG